MSKEKSQNDEQKMTKYELKRKQKQETKAKDAVGLLFWKLAAVLFVIAVLAWIFASPIKNIINKNKTLFTVGDKSIKALEFDYYYNVCKSNYMNSYGSYLMYYGLTEDTDPATVMYNSDLTFKDYFEELAAEQIQQNEALYDEMVAAGFTYDATEDYNVFVDNMTTNAKEAGVSTNAYVRDLYGEYATVSNLKSIIMTTASLTKFYESVYDSKMVSDEDILAYYKENSNDYDSVNYFMLTVNADIPTEPTDLADIEPVYDEEGTYTPSEAEIDAAMEAAKAEADELLESVKTDGEPHVGELSSSVSYYVRDWLFDSARKEGDTTVIENSYSHMYYVLYFDERYLVEEPTVDVRVVITEDNNGEAIKAEYEAGAKTEDSFIELVKKYSADTESVINGGLFEKQDPANFDGELYDWMFSPQRRPGDVETFVLSDTITYTMYYVGQNMPIWKVNITNTLMSEVMNEYVEEIKAKKVILDPNRNLRYLVVQEAQAVLEQLDEAASIAE